jgi:RNA polymerase sigma-70 factor (ECF subfamily)
MHAKLRKSAHFAGVVTFLLLRDSISMGTRPTTFHELYGRYADDVYRFAYWLTGNPHDARDITSETFVRAWTAPEEPRMETVKAYLFTIARNLHRKQWRRQSRFEGLDEAMPDQAAQPDEAAVNQDEFRRTLEAVQALPEIDRTLLLLRAEQELSYQDIAAATGLSVAAAKVKVFRARAKLAALLHPNIGEKQ